MTASLAKKESFKIFDAIAGRYDFVNSILSLGLHHGWRRALTAEAIAGARPDRKIAVLDLATGTGDVALALAREDQVGSVMGIDLSEGMLAVGRQKIIAQGAASKVKLEAGDAMDLRRSGFDSATMAFGIRNVPDPLRCLSEIYRALRPGGRVVILEFALPRSRWFRALHLFYLRHVLPHIGRALSGHQFAYRYLNETIESFPYGDAFTLLMRRAGFLDTIATPLTFGIVNLYRGVKR